MTIRATLPMAALILLLASAISSGQSKQFNVDSVALQNAAHSPEQWLTVGRDYAETRYSPLHAIDAKNVARLGLAWTYDTQSLRGLEATPLVANGVLYSSTAWSNVFALDARTGRELWRWDAKADRIRGYRACCDVVNRGRRIVRRQGVRGSDRRPPRGARCGHGRPALGGPDNTRRRALHHHRSAARR